MGLLKTLIESFTKEKDKSLQVNVSDDVKKYDGINMSSLVVYAPKNITELNKVIDCVAGGQAVIINFANIKKGLNSFIIIKSNNIFKLSNIPNNIIDNKEIPK